MAMSGRASRTIIRDPRKNKRVQQNSAAVVAKEKEQGGLQPVQSQQPRADVGRPIMFFEPSTENRQSLGLGSYVLAGAGVAIGFTLVGAIFGAIG